LRTYLAAGLRVTSEIALPGFRPREPAGAADVTIRLGETPEDLPGAQAGGPTWRMAGEDLLLVVPGIARFHLHDGRIITIQACTAANEADVTAFLLGSAFGILLQQRGRVVLRASAVRVGHRAVLFCGATGAGKSTLAATVSERGWPLLADDICAIDIDAKGGPIAYPEGSGLKLWDLAVARLGLAERRGGALRPSVLKFDVAPKAQTDEALKVGAVYWLETADPTRAPGVQRLDLVDAPRAIRASAYRPSLVTALRQEATYLGAGAAITAAAPVCELIRELRFSALPDHAVRLEQHWRALSLAELEA
jgi:hypothetical protein